MPWKESVAMDQRKLFIVRWQLGEEPFTELCEEFGVARKTGYKWVKRFSEQGMAGLVEGSRVPEHMPRQISNEILCEIFKARQKKEYWGGRKISRYLRNQGFREVPHARTIDRYLKRGGYVTPRRGRRKEKLQAEKLIEPTEPMDVVTVDFKGWWRTGDGKRCEPLTVRDQISKYILNLSAHPGCAFENVKERFSRVFEQYGLPLVIRSDNGAPFASVNAMHRLSRFGVWLMKLGILPNRIQPACPDQNGAHERFHWDIKRELQKNPARELSEEQKRFDIWRQEFNYERPHESLSDDTPAQHFKPSPRKFLGDNIQFEYPPDFQLRKVNKNGEFHWKGKPVGFAKSLAQEYIGIEDCGEPDLKVWFCDFYLGSLHRKAEYLVPSQALSKDSIGRRLLT